MRILPIDVRRKHRLEMLMALTTVVIFLFLSFAMLWIAAGMMINSQRMCWVMAPCRDAQLAQFNEKQNRYASAHAAPVQPVLASQK